MHLNVVGYSFFVTTPCCPPLFVESAKRVTPQDVSAHSTEGSDLGVGDSGGRGAGPQSRAAVNSSMAGDTGAVRSVLDFMCRDFVTVSSLVIADVFTDDVRSVRW